MMQKQFKREQRYFVVKVKDAKEYLDAHQLEKLAEIADTISEGREKGGIPAVECVVVEADWPEYEPTWRAIEARVTGAQPAPSVPDGWKEAAIAWEVCASIHREYGKGKDPFFSTRQGDFVKHANDARAMLAGAPEAKP